MQSSISPSKIKDDIIDDGDENDEDQEEEEEMDEAQKNENLLKACKEDNLEEAEYYLANHA